MAGSGARRAIVPIFIPHLGCPQGCVFCDQRAIAAPQAPTPQAVAQMIEAALPYAGQGEIAFYGGSFTAIPAQQQEAYLAVAAQYVASGQMTGVRLSTRPDCINEAVLARLGRFPVRTVELGAQSMDDSVLAAACRGHTAADTLRAAGLVKAVGLGLVLQMMTGLPGSSHESDLATARALAALGPDGARIYPTCVLRGTPLEQLWQAGRYTPQTLEQATETAAQCLEVFAGAGVPVIRIGLNPTETLSGGAVVAGPYHPAMGELARGRRLRRLAEVQLDALPADARVRLVVPAGRGPLMRGQRACNMDYFSRRHPAMEIAIEEQPGQRAELTVQTV